MPVKLLHNLYQNMHLKPHLNNRLLLLPKFLQPNLEIAPPSEKKAFCHLCAFWKRMLPPPTA